MGGVGVKRIRLFPSSIQINNSQFSAWLPSVAITIHTRITSTICCIYHCYRLPTMTEI